ncbi:hypothetical protein [Nocardia sp. NPDC052112]|uniref:hypothetical protein n=1 Tax=Nocardia sp. NPDC052112 TaxID=3155646 RepID=UPI0034243B7A
MSTINQSCRNNEDDRGGLAERWELDPGVSLCLSSSGSAVRLLVVEHGVDDAGPESGRADEGGVVFLALGTLPTCGLDDAVTDGSYP